MSNNSDDFFKVIGLITVGTIGMIIFHTIITSDFFISIFFPIVGIFILWKIVK